MIPTLLAITPDDGRDLVPWVEAMAGAGLRAVLLRERRLDAGRYRAVATRLRPLVDLLLLHDAVPGARALAAELHAGLHVPAGAPTAGATSASCHTAAEVLACAATFALWSPVYRPRSKDDDRPPLGEDAFVAVAAGRPVLALGGVDPARHARLRARGAAGSAVIGALFGTASPDQAAATVRAFLG